jgi:hypothetical protein
LTTTSWGAKRDTLCGKSGERTKDEDEKEDVLVHAVEYERTCGGSYDPGACEGDDLGTGEGDDFGVCDGAEIGGREDDARGIMTLRRPNRRASNENDPGPRKAETTAIMTTSRLNGLQ